MRGVRVLFGGKIREGILFERYLEVSEGPCYNSFYTIRFFYRCFTVNLKYDPQVLIIFRLRYDFLFITSTAFIMTIKTDIEVLRVIVRTITKDRFFHHHAG